MRMTQINLGAAATAIALAAAGCGGGDGGGGGQAPTASSASGATVTATLADFSITIPGTVRAGNAIIEVRNSGPTPHQLTVRGPSDTAVGATAVLNPGSRTTLSVMLPPGTYSYFCALPGHASLGMMGTFTATAAQGG